MAEIEVPRVERQVFVADYFNKMRYNSTYDALVLTVAEIDPKALRAEICEFAPGEGLALLQGTRIRDEDVFVAPCLLRRRPALLGYYRMLLGISQKQFYTTASGLSAFKALEERGQVPRPADPRLPDLCRKMNESMTCLLRALQSGNLESDVHNLPILTLGAQADGAWRNIIGSSATRRVYGSIKRLVSMRGFELSETEGSFSIINSSGRRVVVSLAADPDVTIREYVPGAEEAVYKVAIEIKGGRDKANVHNRAGEAEKSHQKARLEHAGDCWTIIDKTLTSVERLAEESPSTRVWIDYEAICLEQGADWERARGLIITAMGI